MTTNFKRAAAPALLLAVAAMAAVAAPGCGEDGLGGLQEGLCCTQFKPGTGMVNLDWGLEGQANVQFGAFMQATGDLQVAASGMISDLAIECEAMAIEMGAERPVLTPEQKSDPAARAELFCGLAASAIGSLKAEGSLTVNFDPPKCEVSASAQVDCEASCSANVECEAELGNVEARCEGGELSGKCEGSCSGSCSAEAGVAVNCEGTCSGECTGECDGTCSFEGADGSCKGECDGKCTGTCSASCEFAADAQVQCDAECSGSCSVEFKAPKCDAELTPPSAECQGSAECSGGCDASASAKAECTPPQLTVEFGGSVDASIEAKLAALKLHLPKIIVIAQARAELLVGNLQAVAELGASVSGDLNADAALCIIPAIAAVEDALVNAQVSLSASVNVVTSVGG